jgi:hypothetical protein
MSCRLNERDRRTQRFSCVAAEPVLLGIDAFAPEVVGEARVIA